MKKGMAKLEREKLRELRSEGEVYERSSGSPMSTSNIKYALLYGNMFSEEQTPLSSVEILY